MSERVSWRQQSWTAWVGIATVMLNIGVLAYASVSTRSIDHYRIGRNEQTINRNTEKIVAMQERIAGLSTDLSWIKRALKDSGIHPRGN